MGAVQEIKDAQRDWAGSRGIPFNQCGYVPEVEDNLWRPLTTIARRGFEKGAGSELSKNMKALHSSSALVVNFFDYWTDRDKIPVLTALSIDPQSESSLDFEARFSAELFTPPHLDVAITHGTGVVAVESKFTEHLKRSVTKGKSEFTDSYFPKACLLAKRLPTNFGTKNFVTEDSSSSTWTHGNSSSTFLDWLRNWVTGSASTTCITTGLGIGHKHTSEKSTFSTR